MVMEKYKMFCPTTIGKLGIFKTIVKYVSTIPTVKYKKNAITYSSN